MGLAPAGALLTLSLSVLALAAPSTAHAGQFNVTSAGDAPDATPGNGACATATPPTCTLRAAVDETNALAGADTINVPAGNYAIQNPNAANDLGDLRITGDVTIVGAGRSSTVMDSRGAEGAFFFAGTLAVTLRDLAITGGQDDLGSAMFFQSGSLTLDRVSISGNEGTGPDPAGTLFLGAAFGSVNATIRDSTVSNNMVVGTGTQGDGVIAFQSNSGGSLDVVRSTFSTNVVAGGLLNGGVISFKPRPPASTLRVSDSTFTGNRVGAGGDGGAIFFRPDNFGDATATIERSSFSGNRADEAGGAIFAQMFGSASSLSVSGSSFADNSTGGGGSFGGGGAIRTGGAPTTIDRSTFARNVAGGAGRGGGIDSASEFTVTNSTLSGNRAADGGGISASSGGSLSDTTIASNTAATSGGGVAGALTARRTILAANTRAGAASNCSAPLTSAGNNLESADTCALSRPTDRKGSNPKLAPLASNGGPTQTHALLPGSPALDAGGAGCPATDQRGVSRPRGAACDIGSFEVVPAVFRVDGDDDRDGVPNSRDTCPIVFARTLNGCPLPPPVRGSAVNAEPKEGEVFVSLPTRTAAASGVMPSPPARAAVPGLKGRTFIPLREARQLPVGTFFDTRSGTVRITSARDGRGRTQSAEFLTGVFQVLQSRERSAKGLTEMRLKGSSFRRCRAGRAGRAGAAAAVAPAGQAARRSRRTIRRLRGRGTGRFRTRGRHSAATVRGTDWTVFDRCDGTLTKVSRGRVAVRDFRRRKTVLMRAGKRYLARAPR